MTTDISHSQCQELTQELKKALEYAKSHHNDVIMFSIEHVPHIIKALEKAKGFYDNRSN